MTSEWTNPAGCNCLALRQAARHVSQFYDQFLAPSGLRTTQYSILARLQRNGAMTINALAADLVIDRTTLGRNLLPLEREGLIAIEPGQADRRSKDVRLTGVGATRLRSARRGWEEAQAQFEKTFGVRRAKDLRALLHEIATERKIAGAEAPAAK
ncbi:MAG TPA: MarR family winged helix-turn-helix transcriptional regulator [Xanthobacteraceae bacterium]|nr:MarR family winged helix-turn-helix transcriptional regulator [Xanthobacteraceae bacterium]